MSSVLKGSSLENYDLLTNFQSHGRLGRDILKLENDMFCDTSGQGPCWVMGRYSIGLAWVPEVATDLCLVPFPALGTRATETVYSEIRKVDPSESGAPDFRGGRVHARIIDGALRVARGIKPRRSSTLRA